ncbi:MAG: hypothetical protein ACT6FE_04010 [Methanosarcinaceae archaeon]
MNHINPAHGQIASCTYALDTGTQYILIFLVLAIGLSLAYVYFRINCTLKETNSALEKISDLFDTLE